MASEIKIKGRKEPIETTFVIADRIKALWLNKEVPKDAKIEVGDWVGTKDDIKSIWLDRKGDVSSRAEKLDTMAQANADYIKQRKEFQALSLDEKAKQVGFFKMLYYGYVKELKVPDEIIEKAIERQRAFFKEHPFNILPDPLIFKDLINSKDNSCLKPIFSIVSMSISTDKKYTEQEELYHGNLSFTS